MKKILLPLLLLTISTASPAGEFGDLTGHLPKILKQLDGLPPALIPLKTRAEYPSTPDNLYWTHLYSEIFAKGAAIFEYKGQKYAIKPMFKKGRYDIEEGTYISIPAVYIMNIMDVENKAPLEGYFDINSPVDALITTNSGDKIRIKNENATISILSHGGSAESLVFSISHKKLFRIWAENAEQYKRTVHSKTIYLVPQMIRSAQGFAQVGFVASEGTPLSTEAKHPLDYIALCQAKDGVTCRPLRYSIPLGLKFKYIGIAGTGKDKDFFHWKIEEMVNEDLYDALDDEALEATITP